jgi:hypothetical protein
MNGTRSDDLLAHSGPIHRAMDAGSVSPLPQITQLGDSIFTGVEPSKSPPRSVA